MISAVELAEQIMDDCSDEESLAVEIVILPIDNVDFLTSDEEVQNYDVMMNNEIPSDVCGMVQAQTNILNGEHNNNKVEDDDNAKEEKWKWKRKTRVWTFKDVEECKSKPRSSMNKIPAKNQFLELIKMSQILSSMLKMIL